MRRSGGQRRDGTRGKGGARDHTGPSGKPKQRDASTGHQPEHSAGRSANAVPSATGSYGRDLRELLAGLGTPKAEPFRPDPFQLEALNALEFEDVLVTAPTGSGKTWIAREEIRRLLDVGKRAWY